MAVREVLAAVGLLVGMWTAAVGIAHADPASPAPAPTITSTDDELTDMVMDAISHGAAAPFTTPAVAPPH